MKKTRTFDRVARLLILATLLTLFLLASPRVVEAQTPCQDPYTVTLGDTLTQIASRCETTIPAILELNPDIINPDLIFVGQQIDLPDADGEPVEPGEVAYIVKQGDWLSKIARRFGTSVSAIVQANPAVTNPDLIYPGQRLVIPGATGSRVTISPTSGPPGTEVSVDAGGFPANTIVEIGVGEDNSEFEVIATAETDDAGTVETTATIPESAQANEEWVVVVRVEGTQEKATSNLFSVTAPGQFTRAQIYLIALDDGGTSGPLIGCNDSAVPVEVQFDPTPAPLTAALTELLAIEEQFYGGSGLYNALYQSDLTIEDVNISNGVATIELSGAFTIGGACDEPRVEAQLKRTATQFSTVDEATVFINGTSLEDIFGPE